MAFHDYSERFESRDFRKALIELFEVLDTPNDKRDPYLDDELASFPMSMVGCLQKRILKSEVHG